MTTIKVVKEAIGKSGHPLDEFSPKMLNEAREWLTDHMKDHPGQMSVRSMSEFLWHLRGVTGRRLTQEQKRHDAEIEEQERAAWDEGED